MLNALTHTLYRPFAALVLAASLALSPVAATPARADNQDLAAFLAALCAFFNSHWGQVLLERAGCPNLCDLAGKLDAERSAVIAELFLTYQGW